MRRLPACFLLFFAGPLLGQVFEPPASSLFVANPRSEVDVTTPLATAAEANAFQATFNGIIEEANRGSPADRALAATLLTRRAQQAGVGTGTKRLLLIAAFELIARANVAEAEVTGAGDRALGVLEEETLAVVTARTNVRRAAALRLTRPEGRYAPRLVALDLLMTSEMHFRSGDIHRASAVLEESNPWLQKDPEYARLMAPRIEKYTQVLHSYRDADAQLATNAADPAANTRKACLTLLHSRNLADAAPYLAKSDAPELRRLGSAFMLSPGVGAKLEVMASAADAVKVCVPEVQVVLAQLVHKLEQEISADRSAGPDQKARAELLLLKLDQIAGTLDTQAAATRPAVPRPDVPPVPNLEARFFGVASSVRRVVYIVDHSGSMLDNFESARKEIVRSTSALAPTQFFAVVLVSDRVDVPTGRQMLAASPVNIKNTVESLQKVRAEGQNDDLLAPFQTAFERAFALNPEAIFFLTDGRFGKKLPDVVARLNAGRKVRINTLALVSEEREYREALQRLAQANGGEYRFVPEREIRPPAPARNR